MKKKNKTEKLKQRKTKLALENQKKKKSYWVKLKEQTLKDEAKLKNKEQEI